MFKTFPIGELFECAKGDIDLQQKDINGKGDYFIKVDCKMKLNT